MLPNKWDEYYIKAQKEYAKGSPVKELNYNLYDLTARVHDPDDPSDRDIVQVGDNYSELVTEISNWVNDAFNNPSLYSREGMAYGLKDIFQVPRLDELTEMYASQLEKNLFNSHVHVDNIKIYRNFITNESPRSSWMWHFDNNIREQVKILLYLTDVEDGCGQYELVYDIKRGEGIKVPSSRTSWDAWEPSANSAFYLSEYEVEWHGTDRVPGNVIRDLLSKGIKVAKILGKKGKFLLFDNNIIHRATVAKKRHRDAIVFQFKPSIEKIEPALNPINTGNGWDHNTFNADPRILEALVRIPENSLEAQVAKLKEESV